MYVDNEYFNRGSDDFGNPKITSVTINRSKFTSVSIQQDNSYGPYSLRNNGNTVNATVYYNGVSQGTITIRNNNGSYSITQVNGNNNGSITIEDDNGIGSIEFVFSSRYRSSNNNWSTNAIEYKAIMKARQLSNGGEIEFTHE